MNGTRVAPELHRLDLLTVLDVMTLAAYCQAYCVWRTAVEAFTHSSPACHSVACTSWPAIANSYSFASKWQIGRVANLDYPPRVEAFRLGAREDIMKAIHSMIAA